MSAHLYFIFITVAETISSIGDIISVLFIRGERSVIHGLFLDKIKNGMGVSWVLAFKYLNLQSL